MLLGLLVKEKVYKWTLRWASQASMVHCVLYLYITLISYRGIGVLYRYFCQIPFGMPSVAILERYFQPKAMLLVDSICIIGGHMDHHTAAHGVPTATNFGVKGTQFASSLFHTILLFSHIFNRACLLYALGKLPAYSIDVPIAPDTQQRAKSCHFHPCSGGICGGLCLSSARFHSH